MCERSGQLEEPLETTSAAAEYSTQRCDDLISGSFAPAIGQSVFNPRTHPTAGQQPPRLQRAQILAGSRTRELHLPSDARDTLSGVPREQSQDLKALTVRDDATSAPKSRLEKRRGATIHTLQTLFLSPIRHSLQTLNLCASPDDSAVMSFRASPCHYCIF